MKHTDDYSPDVYPVKDPNAFFKEHDYRPDAACVCGQSHVGQQPCRYCGEPTKYNFCSQECAKANNDLMAQHPDAASPEEVHGRPSVMGSAKKSNGQNVIFTLPNGKRGMTRKDLVTIA